MPLWCPGNLCVPPIWFLMPFFFLQVQMILPAIMLLFTLLLRLSCSPFPSGHYLVISLRGGYREIISRWKEREKDPMGFSVHLQTTSPTSLPPWHHPTLSQTTNQYSALPLFLFLLIHLSFFPSSFLPTQSRSLLLPLSLSLILPQLHSFTCTEAQQ